MKGTHIAIVAGAAFVGYQILLKRRRTVTAPISTVASTAARMPAVVGVFPQWPRDQAKIEAQARIEAAKPPQTTGSAEPDGDASPEGAAARTFVVTRNTLRAFWPSLPWPDAVADLTPEPMPGAPQVFEQRWVSAAGSAGNAMKNVWDHTARFVAVLNSGVQTFA